ncbi:hypothetical protein [Humidesulfovibrio sp.]
MHRSRSTPRLYLALATLALCVLLPMAALAHKVSVFAYVDGPNLVIDAFYSKSNKVNGGKITVKNAATGEVYQQATTDENGALTLPVPAKAIAVKADLRVLLIAGEGHQNDVLVHASEYAALAAAPVATPLAGLAATKPAAKPVATASPSPASPAGPAAQKLTNAAPAPQLYEATLTRIVTQAVDQAVESRMAPVKRLLLESAQKGPGPTEIIGGIGYIVGLFGLAAFFSARRKNKP